MSEALLIIALGVIVVAAVAYPLIAGRARYDDEAALNADVARFQEALDAGTVCGRCRFPNPAGSRFCAECGRALTSAESPADSLAE